MKNLWKRIWTSLPQTCPFPATKNPEASRTGQNVYPGFINLSTDFFLYVGMVSTFENYTPTLTRLSEVFGDAHPSALLLAGIGSVAVRVLI
ncbi:MAG: hypothetical protein DMG09_02740 [Acidobacteria bacterium]|nr:MAG: hypothetical protein DMG09_02740 [Acidobacteriota bacterium]